MVVISCFSVLATFGREADTPLGSSLPHFRERRGTGRDTEVEMVAMQDLCWGVSFVDWSVTYLQEYFIECLTVDVT